MKNKLPHFASSLAWLVVLAGISLVALKLYHPRQGLRIPLLVSGSSLSTPAEHDATAPPDPATDDQPTAGQPLVAQAAERLDGYPAIEARIRQRVDLFGQQISGAGTYQQWGRAFPKRLRLELKFQVGEQVASLQQVSDGRFFWQRRDMPADSGLTRVDLRRIQESMEEVESRPSVLPLHQWMALGGLSRLLRALDEHFDFALAEPRILHDLPVWRLTGHWKAEALDRLVPELAAQRAPRHSIPTEKLPPHLPDTVVLVLGRDERLPLFPYRIEYRRQLPSARGATQTGKTRDPSSTRAASAEIATIELFEVNPAPAFRVEDFNYDPGEQVVHDETEALLRKLGGESPDR